MSGATSGAGVIGLLYLLCVVVMVLCVIRAGEVGSPVERRSRLDDVNERDHKEARS